MGRHNVLTIPSVQKVTAQLLMTIVLIHQYHLQVISPRALEKVLSFLDEDRKVVLAVLEVVNCA